MISRQAQLRMLLANDRARLAEIDAAAEAQGEDGDLVARRMIATRIHELHAGELIRTLCQAGGASGDASAPLVTTGAPQPGIY